MSEALKLAEAFKLVEITDIDLDDVCKNNGWGIDAAEMLKAQVAEIVSLRAELEKKYEEVYCAEAALEVFACDFNDAFDKDGFECLGKFIDALREQSSKERDTLRAERDALKADAERYRWLSKHAVSTRIRNHLGGTQVDTLDAAIDAAKEQQG